MTTAPRPVAALRETEPETTPTCPGCGGRGFVWRGYTRDGGRDRAFECFVCDGSSRGSQWLPEHYRPLIVHSDEIRSFGGIDFSGLRHDEADWTRHENHPDVVAAPESGWVRDEEPPAWEDPSWDGDSGEWPTVHPAAEDWLDGHEG